MIILFQPQSFIFTGVGRSHAEITKIKINLNEGPFTAICGISPKYTHLYELFIPVNCRSWGKQFSRIHMEFKLYRYVKITEIEVHTLGKDYNFHIRF